MNGETTKTLRARELGVSLRSLYYKPKKPDKDWQLKCQIEEVLRTPEQAFIRLTKDCDCISNAIKKPSKRVMKLFGIKAYRRRGRKWKKTKNIKVIYPNMLITTYPAYENHIWTSDFTHIPFQGKTVYVATVVDLFTRKMVGMSVYTNSRRTADTFRFHERLAQQPKTSIFHSDNGSEYNARGFHRNVGNSRGHNFTLSTRLSVGEWLPGIFLLAVQDGLWRPVTIQNTG